MAQPWPAGRPSEFWKRLPFGLDHAQGEWRLYIVLPSRRAWSWREALWLAVGLLVLTLGDARRDAPVPGWRSGENPPPWRHLTIDRIGDVRLSYLTAPLQQVGLEIIPVPARRQGPPTAPLAEIAGRFQAETQRDILGAVNGGFFDTRTGLPIGFLLRDGMMEFFNMPQGVRRSMVGFTRADPSGRQPAQVVISSPEQMPKAWLDVLRRQPATGPRSPVSGSIPVHHVNVPGGRHAFSLFTPHYGSLLRPVPGALYLRARRTAAGQDGRAPVYEVLGPAPDGRPERSIPRDGMLIALCGDSRRLVSGLRPGTLVQPRWTLPKEWRERRVVHGLLAGPRLLENGRLRVSADVERLTHLRSADRMALGVRASGEALLLWLHREGPGVQLDFHHAARILARLGLRDAIALDGGSSRAVLAVARQDYRLARYMDAGRPVANALVVSLPPSRRRS